MAEREGRWKLALKKAQNWLRWYEDQGLHHCARTIKEHLAAYEEGDRTDILLKDLEEVDQIESRRRARGKSR